MSNVLNLNELRDKYLDVSRYLNFDGMERFFKIIKMFYQKYNRFFDEAKYKKCKAYVEYLIEIKNTWEKIPEDKIWDYKSKIAIIIWNNCLEEDREILFRVFRNYRNGKSLEELKEIINN